MLLLVLCKENESNGLVRAAGSAQKALESPGQTKGKKQKVFLLGFQLPGENIVVGA